MRPSHGRSTRPAHPRLPHPRGQAAPDRLPAHDRRHRARARIRRCGVFLASLSCQDRHVTATVPTVVQAECTNPTHHDQGEMKGIPMPRPSSIASGPLELKPQTDSLQPIARDTLQERVYLRIRQALIYSEFEPGQVLTIRELARKLGTSILPVREAL